MLGLQGFRFSSSVCIYAGFNAFATSLCRDAEASPCHGPWCGDDDDDDDDDDVLTIFS